MGVRITSQEDKVALFDSVTGHAFGPVFDSEWEAEEFTDWFQRRVEDGTYQAQTDLRQYRGSDLDALVNKWRDSLEMA